MSVQIRPAKPDDAPAIARIAATALATSIDAGSPRVRQILSEGLTYVATQHGVVVGFIDSFFTFGQTGGRRFEVDLLALASQERGRGVGSSLAAKSLAVAADTGARSIRALVRSDNVPMQRVCSRHGFTRTPTSFKLYFVDPKPVARPKRYHEAHLIPVETLSYGGIWMEGSPSQEAIDDAQLMASQGDMSRIGAVIPSESLAVAELLQANSFQLLGEYHWWTINLRSD